MLRSTRSMPTLKALNQTIKSEVQQQTTQFSTISSKYNLIAPNIPYSKNDSLKSKTFKRLVHETSKKNSSSLLNTKSSEFSLMSLNTLKQECRKRGLKVSGRKSELISRISTYETSFSTKQVASISTSTRPSTLDQIKSPWKKMESKLTKSFKKTTKTEAKGDDSHIDFIKSVDSQPPKTVGEDYITQIPSLSTDASQTPVTKFEKDIKNYPTNPNDTIVSKAEGSDIKIFEQGSIDQIDEQNFKASNVTEDVFEQEKEEGSYEWDNTQFNGNEKGIFVGVLASIGLWWSLKPNKIISDDRIN
ncbi:hypothetical protein WICMUC_004334 [Wickerhamomyces mucosus]|uniref:SAP domain-containing protein n=1 Tax=Wickerhamomyces mucosus TaxID=1378264 RepID=A0A9P8PHU6_9ASCO|nr:hypothetical protein WICMUC_004334 [Wickerhamomyces mucosus]